MRPSISTGVYGFPPDRAARIAVDAIKAMEKLGYIVRRQQADSRRKVYVFLTPKGKSLKKRLVPFAEEVNKLALAGLSDTEITTTRHSLLRMVENLAKDQALTSTGATPADE